MLFTPKKTADETLHLEVRGQGAHTVVFLAGLGGTTRYWDSRVKNLEVRHRVVLADLLGFGESPKPWTTYSVERHVAALRTALADLGPVTLVGHSLGALLTVAYAARYPANVCNLVLIALPYFRSRDHAYRYFRRGPVRGGFVYTNVALTMLACVVTRRVLGRLLPHVIKSVPREVAEDLVKHTWRSSTSSLWAVVYEYDVAGDLAGLPDAMEVLFIHGAQDLIAPLSAIRPLVDTRPRTRLRVLGGADHHPFLRDPTTCLALIDDAARRARPKFDNVLPLPHRYRNSTT